MISFRKKIFITYIIFFFIFLALLIPLSRSSVNSMARNQLEKRAQELINMIKSAKNQALMIQILRDKEHSLFLRASLLTSKGEILYDSHVEKLLGKNFIRGYQTYHPEVAQALKNGFGYAEGYSWILKQDFAYIAIPFPFKHKILIMRTAFPHKEIQDMIKQFQLGILLGGCMVLALFSLLTWIIINKLTKPIQKIIDDIKPYQDKRMDHLPVINLSGHPESEFVKLANTFNGLTQKIDHHIETLTKERNEKATILESLTDGVIAIDIHLCIIYMNNVACDLLNIESTLAMKKQLSHFLSNNPKDNLVRISLNILKDCLDQQLIISETLTVKENNLILDFIAIPKPDGAILVIQDKSSHYKMLEMRKDFIANASHELKTPITIIRGFAETLHENSHLGKDLTQNVLLKIVTNCIRMEKIVKNLLTLSDVENLPLFRLKNCNMLPIIESCIQMIKTIYTDANIEIQYDPEKYYCIIGEDNLLELAFKNLIENAAKYSNEPASISIKLLNIDKHLQISITDKGIGIPKEDLEHIFDRFYTVNKAHSRRLGGSGLGLSLVHTIITKHHGKISIDSELSKGTCFTILIPHKFIHLDEDNLLV